MQTQCIQFEHFRGENLPIQSVDIYNLSISADLRAWMHSDSRTLQHPCHFHWLPPKVKRKRIISSVTLHFPLLLSYGHLSWAALSASADGHWLTSIFRQSRTLNARSLLLLVFTGFSNFYWFVKFFLRIDHNQEPLYLKPNSDKLPVISHWDFYRSWLCSFARGALSMAWICLTVTA